MNLHGRAFNSLCCLKKKKKKDVQEEGKKPRHILLSPPTVGLHTAVYIAIRLCHAFI